MTKLITDIETIARMSEQNEDENIDFRCFLKGDLDWSDKRLDALVHKILKSVASGIDCTKCANCCRSTSTGLLPDEIERLAVRLGLSIQEFEDKYITTGDFHNEKMIAEIPCPFLNDCTCTVYEDRPSACKEYPHIQKDGFLSRSLSVLGNAEICPIVFNVLEQLKEHFGWQSRRRRARRWS